MSARGYSSRRDEAVADEYLGDHMACRVCRAMTHREELGAYGATCQQCYEAWCAKTVPAWLPRRALTPTEVQRLRERIRTGLRAMVAQHQHPRSWVERLQGRVAQGFRVTAFQAQALQEMGAGEVFETTTRGAEAAEPVEV